jgi:hypothetical protein
MERITFTQVQPKSLLASQSPFQQKHLNDEKLAKR